MPLSATRDYRRMRPLPKPLDCYAEAGLDAVKAILNYRAGHQFQAQP